MGILIAGVLTWSIVHWYPAAFPAARARAVERLGANAYRGLFALFILLGLGLIIYGWRHSPVVAAYAPPAYGSPVVPILVFLAFFLFAASHAPGNTRRFLRHPMLLGTIVWAVAHLLSNGETRSVVLFGGLGMWALISIVLINRRDRAWEKPAPEPLSRDIMTLAGAAVVFAVVLLLHRWLFGVSPLPGL